MNSAFREGRAKSSLLVVLTLAACSNGTVPAESMPVRASAQSAFAQHPDSALRAELIALGEDDQAVRAGLTPETFQDTAFVARIERTDSARSR